MTRRWGSTTWGERLTGVPAWSITLDKFELLLSVGGKTTRGSILHAEHLKVRPGLIWATVDFGITSTGHRSVFGGIPNARAVEMSKAFEVAREDLLHQARKQRLIADFCDLEKAVVQWAESATTATKKHLHSRGWLTVEFSTTWDARKPSPAFKDLLKEPDLEDHLQALSTPVKDSFDLWRSNFSQHIAALNEEHLESELKSCKTFLEQVEKSPLTAEQARAVICFDNRVQVIASAGSGKTSTMVAKAGYALHRNLVPAEKILLLAFNADAAKELQQRIHDRLAPLGFPAERIAARTFHAFGLDIIGAATGEKPTLAPWLEHGGDVRELMSIVDHLKDTDHSFRSQWDLFRVVLGRDLPAFGKEEDSPEDWDRDTKAKGFRTLKGDVVKSQGERLIADWLFYNGVRYVYEQPYAVKTADAQHRQYCPDFYYPGIDVYHEHWALDSKGQPPAHFVGYLDGMKWKRALHHTSKTSLIETTMADLWSGKLFKHLAEELVRFGVTLDPQPDRPVEGRRPIENEDLVRTFRTFLTHAKGNRITDAELGQKLKEEGGDKFRFRHGVFFNLFVAIRREWERRLATNGWIDFDDMLNLAVDHLESDRWSSPFDLIMVDEFQDASRARARMTRELVKKSGKYLFAVGDDWQSINRFAGADMSVMTEFERWFGKGQTLRLERTFRCPQSICDISSQFVLKNTAQLSKKVVSTTAEHSVPLSVIQVSGDENIAGVIRKFLIDLHTKSFDGGTSGGGNGVLSVFVLGRYRRDERFLPQWQDLSDRLRVTFLTIHGSKGLEADYVILPRMTSGSYAFPSTIIDDPVLQLAMPESEIFPHAEERRLMYVALTRARRSVLLLTVEHKPSGFLLELKVDHKLTVLNETGGDVNLQACPACGKGSIVQRHGRYGAFFGCNRYPLCEHTKTGPSSSWGGGSKASRKFG